MNNELRMAKWYSVKNINTSANCTETDFSMSTILLKVRKNDTKIA